MSDPYVGEIRIFGFTFAPVKWATCDGQLLPISQNTALFSLLGTNFGGNGTSNFGLPNLQGNVPLDFGQGPGLSPYDIGEVGGVPTVTLNTRTSPAHTHPVNCLGGSGSQGDQNDPKGNIWSIAYSGRAPDNMYAASPGNGLKLNEAAFSVIGNGQPHNNQQPYLVLNICIALAGEYPVRG
jgi:microcystin-dependent protein